VVKSTGKTPTMLCQTIGSTVPAKLLANQNWQMSFSPGN
jgi:hypothetical protein